ncbi:MAG: VCBS repeat-containing protein, partial [Bacteroidota bacterium]
NQGNMQFLPTQVDGYQNGRWLTADAGDVDGDGDEDVVLGNFSQGPGQGPREAIGPWVNSPGFMLWRHNTR